MTKSGDELVKARGLASLIPQVISRTPTFIVVRLVTDIVLCTGLLLNLICQPFHALVTMTLDEKIRYGMMALGGASLVFAALGVHITPLEVGGGAGGW